MRKLSKWNKKKKKWHDKRCKKIKKEKKIQRQYVVEYNRNNLAIDKVSKATHKHRYTVHAPENLSIINNADETYYFINRITDEIRTKKFGTQFYFDLSLVKKITIDSIIYIIAILNNISAHKALEYRAKGNRPYDEQAHNIFVEAGFYNFVKSPINKKQTMTNKLQIRTNDFVDPETAKEVCNFVNKSCNTKMAYTDELYNVIIELMTNTIQHAYNNEEILHVNQWYLYVEEINSHINFSFVDTGEGIPSTISKKWSEKFKDVVAKNDSGYISSALKGEFRSQTTKTYRGKGLPSIAEYAKNCDVRHFQIFSDYGYCELANCNDNGFKCRDYKRSIFGTLYYWQIDKNRIEEKYYVT